ncbi:hypothetical protein LTR50_006341 [Elasticomyces elasticus]|nr:hypothetical protein LTR50_006341 [Elasticomyces elasticus]
MSWLLGRASTSFYHSHTPLTITTKSGERITLDDLCKAATPPCDLNPLLFNGHLQTAYTAVKAAGPPIIYKRRIFEAEDPAFAGSFAVDFVAHEAAPSEDEDDTLPPRTTYYNDTEWDEVEQGSADSRPLLISLHGLSGGSHEIYLRHVLAPLVEQTAAGGWEALVVNSRGCAQSKITSSVLYNARATWDVRQVVKWCGKRWPNRPLFAIGYSLGANILTNYLGEEGDQCVLKAAVVCSNPWKLEVSSLALQRTWLGLEVYSRTMGSSMKKLFETHADQISENTNIDISKVRSIRYLHEFDRVVQCATWGYPTEGAYYRDATSADSLFAVRVPLFAIHAEDDPVNMSSPVIAVKEAIPYEEFAQSPYTVLCTTSTGGHLSWFEWGGGRWFAKPAVNFLQKMAKEIDLSALEEQKQTSSNANGSAKVSVGNRMPFAFDPMRRKMFIASPLHNT